MKRLILAASMLALAGCSQAEEADATDETAAAAPEEAAALALDGKPAAGMYKVTDAEGAVYMYEAKADGTYVSMKDGEVVQTGTWDQPSPDQFCSQADAKYISEEEDGERGCSTESYNDEGVWISTNEDGETVTVERVES